MDFTHDDLLYFCKNIHDTSFVGNNGGMGSPDLFTLYHSLKKIQPKIVIESGVWNGISTKLIRKTLPDAIIICLDPREIPLYGFRDYNEKTKYYIGKYFQDFSTLDLSSYNSSDVFAFFDCHQNAPLRLLQCIDKNITHTFFNDNYPKNCGSHFTINHLRSSDERFSIDVEKKNKIQNAIELYHIFPNIYPGKIKTGEGLFECQSFYDNFTSDAQLEIFKSERNNYRWNTYIKLKKSS